MDSPETNSEPRVFLARPEQSERMAALKAMGVSQRKLFLGITFILRKSASPESATNDNDVALPFD